LRDCDIQTTRALPTCSGTGQAWPNTASGGIQMKRFVTKALLAASLSPLALAA
jgi:hypothetical protein